MKNIVIFNSAFSWRAAYLSRNIPKRYLHPFIINGYKNGILTHGTGSMLMILHER